MKNYAYGRVSSRDQNLERQLDAFENCGIVFDKIFYDKKSGKDFNRENYRKMIRCLKAGDLLVIKSIDRLGRSYDAILFEWRRITKEIKADVWVLDMPLLDTRTREDNLIGRFIADLVLQLLSFFAQHERDYIRMRQEEGNRAAQQRGVHFGRPRIECPNNFERIVNALERHEITPNEAFALADMRPSTFYRYARELLEE